MSSANEIKQDVILKKGDLAPFDGILQSEENYRFDANELVAKRIYESNFRESQVLSEGDEFLKGILIGIGCGVLGTLAINKLILAH